MYHGSDLKNDRYMFAIPVGPRIEVHVHKSTSVGDNQTDCLQLRHSVPCP